ncbi:MAG: EVE domain-containing protein [Chloroflexi bacterium]|nr:EVE domain-containing protein [Chloroflexota bacterium]
MQQFWLVVGTERNWNVAFQTNGIWGLKDFRELRALWNMLREGDGLLFYVSRPVHGIVGLGHVVTKFNKQRPCGRKRSSKTRSSGHFASSSMSTIVYPLDYGHLADTPLTTCR